MNNPVQQQQQPQPAIGPKTVILYRNSQYGFGFTLRHFIVYPPESPAERTVSGILNLTKPMDTVFVKDVRINGPAHVSGLRPGDRLLSVNGMAVAGTLYANVVRAIQQTPAVLKLIVVPKDCDILQTLFSESAHSPESNQRPCIYANPQEISLNPNVQLNANHVSLASPKLATNCGVESINPHRISTIAKYSHESTSTVTTAEATAHRHSFNESIYSEPYSGNRFMVAGGRRFEQPNQPNPLCESSSASNISGHNRCVISGNRQYPVTFSSATNTTTTSIRRENIYGNIGTIASNRTSTTEQSNSTRSSIYSDKTISNEQTSPKTLNPSTIKWPSDEQTNQTQSINNITCASNASSGSPIHSLQQSNRNTKTESKVSSPLKAKQLNIVAATALSPTAACSESTDQKPVVGITTAVIRRPKSSNSSTDRPVRRISYLRATSNDISVQESTNLDERIEKLPREKDQCLSDELQQLIQFCKKSTSIEKLNEPDLEGKLNIKVSYIESKRATVRQWHRVLAKVRADKFEIILLRNNESEEPSEISGIIDLQHFFVMKSNYTKRKYVFKVTNCKQDLKPQSPTNASTADNSKTEFLIQTDDQASFDSWKNAMAKVARSSDENTELKPLQVQTQEKSNGNTSTLEKDVSVTSSSSSSKTRTWKGLVRQFRRIHGQQTSAPNSPNSNNNSMDMPTVASIGVPLAQCPVSAKNKYVPFILARCTEIVETRGLCIVGIYRIPGNTAAITALTELVNKGFDEQTLGDPRWDDVNVVSSLLKLFLRRLPEALIPNDMYKHFIDVDDETGQKRLIGLKVLIDNMSIQFYESLKHLMRHLFLISQNCQTNLMEPKNLAIIFGPSVVRTSNETLETVVKDMKHQCRIVEALVSHYEYFFENAELPAVREQLEQPAEAVPRTHTNLLLDNVAKIESFTDQIEKTRFVFKFVQAARSRRSKKKQTSTLSSITSDTMSVDSSSTSTEYRDSSMTKTENLTDVDGLQSSLSADDSADLFCEDSGSMSLATLIPALEDKFYALHNDPDVAEGFVNERNETSSPLSSSILRNHQLISLQPLTIGDETIPYADDSPDQPIIPLIGTEKSTENPPNLGYAFCNNRNKQWNPTTSNIPYTNRLIGNAKAYRNHHQDTVDAKSINSIASDDNDDTDESNTSETERNNQTIRINSEVIREMNRILTNLERKATKLNRSLSLNIKYHHNECCCNSGHYTMSNSNHSSCRSIAMNRYSLTKDEKTDKNLNLAKKRQIQDNNPKNKRYINRPIKRRHTVGGIHYGYNNKAHSAVVDTTQTR